MRLLAHDDGTYEWVPATDYRVAEVRLLRNVDTVGSTHDAPSRAKDNLLIHGDALNALTALSSLPEFAREYVGKVRLAYLDPPFNTQQSFLQYDDALEHSVWLAMLRDRLLQIKPLMADDGSVWVHCDDSEQHRLRCVMDEVFGPQGFVATVMWENRYSRSNDAGISVSHQYLVIYAPNPALWKDHRNRLGRTADQAEQYRNPDNDPDGPWRSIPWDAPGIRQNLSYPIVTPGGQVRYPPAGRHWSRTEDQWLDVVQSGRAYCGEDGNGAPAYKQHLKDAPKIVPNTWWSHEECGHSDEAAKEIKSLFPGRDGFATPKPERLMARVIEIATNPNDIVLDCFLGSGTTVAVAHKMGRRWIGIEREASVLHEFALQRLAKVVAGQDLGGVTAVETPVGDGLPEGVKPGEARAAAKTLDAMFKGHMLNSVSGLDAGIVKGLVKALRDADKTKTERTWQGGGGFRLLQVAPSMFANDEGIIVLAEWATNGSLAEATAAQLGYEYNPDPPFCGKRGRARLAVIDGLINEGVIRVLVSALGDGERLQVCGTAVEPEARNVLKDLCPGSTIRKIPASILSVYREGLSSSVLAAQEGEKIRVPDLG